MKASRPVKFLPDITKKAEDKFEPIQRDYSLDSNLQRNLLEHPSSSQNVIGVAYSKSVNKNSRYLN